jgi:cyclic pyranopterin phosphate synthase
LRVSVTDRCNLRCVYCNPLEDDGLVADGDVLSFQEIHRVVGLCARCGITRVRLTGGEPLVREGIVELVRSIAGIPAIEDLSLTTNGVLFAPMAAKLSSAGLTRVNISLDAAERACYGQMTGSDALPRVMNGIDEALTVGLNPVRLNCVVLRGMNLAEVPRLAAMSLERPVSVRFIEYYPTGSPAGPMDWYVPTREVRTRIESHLGPLVPYAMTQMSGPASYFRAAGAPGTIGFISGRSSMLCPQCSRLRLTCNGKLRPCLHSAQCYNVKNMLRSGAGDEELLELIDAVLQAKSRYTNSGQPVRDFSMQHVGG